MQAIKLISVYINPTMYRSLFELNPFLWPYECIGIDNREQNLGLPLLYNRLIAEHLSEDCWLFFVHEDFEIKQSLDALLDLDPQHIYGTFGIKMEHQTPVGYGQHLCSHKDGREVRQVGDRVESPVQVATLDCQSVLVHTSLLRQYPELRFDEQLSFDLYAEALCIEAAHVYGINSYVVPLCFQHYSLGKVTERYHRGLAYLAKRYPDVAVPGSCSFIGGAAAELEKHFQYDIPANCPNHS